MFVPPQPLIYPAPRTGTLRRVVIANVLIVKGVRQSVLRNNVEISSIKILIPFKPRRLEALR